MSEKETLRKKLEAELDAAEAKLRELTAKAKSKAGDAAGEYEEQIAALKQHVEKGRDALARIADASDEAWDSIRGGLESAWGSMRKAVTDAASKLKE